MKKQQKKKKTSSQKGKDKGKSKSVFRWVGMAVLVFLFAIIYSFCCVSFLTPSKTFVQKVLEKVPQDAKYLVMVDFSKASAQERLYIYDVAESDFVYSGVVQHGLGRGSTARVPEFSNELGSKCSSLGLFRIAEFSKINRIKHMHVPCFRLDGLSSTNSNARRRGLLIHPSVTTTLLPFEVWGLSLPLTKESEGCFSVSAHTMFKIAKLNLKGSMYLYAYNGENAL